MIEIKLTRSNRFVRLSKDENTHYAMDVAANYGFIHINPLDVKDCMDHEWVGIEFNFLLTKDGRLYAFRNWIGEYPFITGILLEEIGEITKEETK